MVLRPQRSEPPKEDFVDPVNRFEPARYSDPLEESLCEEHVTVIQHQPYTTVTPDTTIAQAIKLMVDGDMSCLMVAEGTHLLGMFTERDVLNKVADRYTQIKDHPVSLVMTHDPAIVHVNDSPAKALNLMAIAGFRHVPILDMNQGIVGIVGPRRTVAYLQKFLIET